MNLKRVPLNIPGLPKAGPKQPPERHVVEQSTVRQLQRYVPPPRKPRK